MHSGWRDAWRSAAAELRLSFGQIVRFSSFDYVPGEGDFDRPKRACTSELVKTQGDSYFAVHESRLAHARPQC